VEFSPGVRNVLVAAGLKTVGEVRETSDEILLSFQDLEKDSVTHLRETLGLPSCDGSGRVRVEFQATANVGTCGGQVKANLGPPGATLIKNLLTKGWIEKRDIVANEVSDHAQASRLASVDSEAGANFAADRSKRFAQLPA
jgi:hypothetical protein